MTPEARIVSDVVRRMTEMIQREVREKLGPSSLGPHVRTPDSPRIR